MKRNIPRDSSGFWVRPRDNKLPAADLSWAGLVLPPVMLVEQLPR